MKDFKPTKDWLTIEKGASIAGLGPLSLQGMDWPMTVVIHGPILTGENEYHPDLAITLWPNAAIPRLEMAIRQKTGTDVESLEKKIADLERCGQAILDADERGQGQLFSEAMDALAQALKEPKTNQ